MFTEKSNCQWGRRGGHEKPIYSGDCLKLGGGGEAWIGFKCSGRELGKEEGGFEGGVYTTLLSLNYYSCQFTRSPTSENSVDLSTIDCSNDDVSIFHKIKDFKGFIQCFLSSLTWQIGSLLNLESVGIIKVFHKCIVRIPHYLLGGNSRSF